MGRLSPPRVRVGMGMTLERLWGRGGQQRGDRPRELILRSLSCSPLSWRPWPGADAFLLVTLAPPGPLRGGSRCSAPKKPLRRT